MLVVSNVTKKYHKVVANEDINFVIEDGNIGILLGPNGAGKSTLARNLGRLYRRAYVDTDRMAERLLCKSVRECFEQDGEAAFDVAQDDQRVAGVDAEHITGLLGDDELALFADLDGPGVLAGGRLVHMLTSCVVEVIQIILIKLAIVNIQ